MNKLFFSLILLCFLEAPLFSMDGKRWRHADLRPLFERRKSFSRFLQRHVNLQGRLSIIIPVLNFSGDTRPLPGELPHRRSDMTSRQRKESYRKKKLSQLAQECDRIEGLPECNRKYGPLLEQQLPVKFSRPRIKHYDLELPGSENTTLMYKKMVNQEDPYQKVCTCCVVS